MSYNGKEICQGCNRPGTEKMRYTKTSLCEDCRTELIAGRTAVIESKIIYKGVFQHYHAYRSINDCVHELLTALHNKSAKTLGVYTSLKHAFGGNGNNYKIDERFVEPLAKCFSKLDEESWKLYKERNALPELAKQEVQKEKDRIFNEGVEKGRSLLFQLNTGEISMTEFEQNLFYKK